MMRTRKPTGNAAVATTFGRIAATVTVSDMPRALDFYVGVLGMTKTFENGNPVGFAIVERDAAELHLLREPDHRASANNVAHLLVADATALHQQLVSRGATIVKAMRDADYGLRTFVFADPDGNRIDVGQRLPSPVVEE